MVDGMKWSDRLDNSPMDTQELWQKIYMYLSPNDIDDEKFRKLAIKFTSSARMTDQIFGDTIEQIEDTIGYFNAQYPDKVQNLFFAIIDLWNRICPEIIDLTILSHEATYHSHEKLDRLDYKLISIWERFMVFLEDHPQHCEDYFIEIANNKIHYDWMVDMLEELMKVDHDDQQKAYEQFYAIYAKLFEIFNHNTDGDKYFEHTKAFTMTIAGEFDYRMGKISEAEEKFQQVIRKFENYGWVYDYWIEAKMSEVEINKKQIKELYQEFLSKKKVFEKETYDFDQLNDRMENYSEQLNLDEV